MVATRLEPVTADRTAGRPDVFAGNARYTPIEARIGSDLQSHSQAAGAAATVGQIVRMGHAVISFLGKRRSLTRTAAHVLFGAVIWPLFTALGATISLCRLPYYTVPVWPATVAAVTGVAIGAGDLLLAGTIFYGLSCLIFRELGRSEKDGRCPAARLMLEPLVTFAATIWGASLWYPGILSDPILSAFGNLPAVAVVALLGGFVVVGVACTGAAGARVVLGGMLLALGGIVPAAPMVRAGFEGTLRTSPSVVVLGIDSLSYVDDLAAFRFWVEAEGGTWYERAVTPGLLTNAVWTSILTMEPVRTHGVFHTFQQFPQRGAPALLAAARARGYRTVSLFSDQSTCAVGSQAGFNEDRSGPVGWRQILLPLVANSSVLVPIVRPALPLAWPSPLAANQAGVFTYDLRRDIRAILSSGGRQRTLSIAHLTYLHLPAYPHSADLSWGELRRIALAPARALRDRGFDWQAVDLATDPLPLRRWKLLHLLRTIESEVVATRYLAEGGRLVVFSDHGERTGLTMATFADQRYYHVVLSTFGVPPRQPAEPVSVIDIGSLLGLAEGRAEPAVEFALAAPEVWPALVNSARLRWSGQVELHERLLAQAYSDLRRHLPWPSVKRTDPPADRRSSAESMRFQ